jgi:hypothetical protein
MRIDIRRVLTMQKIRIAPENWGRVWRTLVAAGPVSRVSEEPVYLVTEEQVALLRRKRLTFELLAAPNGRSADRSDG